MEFKDTLKKLRADKNMTQQALADALFTSRSTVAKWENGLSLPNEQSLALIAGYFGVPEAQLIPDAAVENAYIRKNTALSRSKKMGILLAALCMILAVAIVLTAIFAGENETPIGGSTPRIVGANISIAAGTPAALEHVPCEYDSEHIAYYSLTVCETYILEVDPRQAGGSRDAAFYADDVSFRFDDALFSIEKFFPDEDGIAVFRLTVLQETAYAAIGVSVNDFSDVVVVSARLVQ